MTQVLAVVAIAALVVVAGLAFATAAGARLLRASSVGSWVAEAVLVLAALLDVARVIGGRRPDELVVHLGYVVVSVALLPVLVRPTEDEPSDDDIRGRQLVLAVACLADVVVVLRQRATG